MAPARAEPDRYLVLDANLPVGEITELIKDKVREILPDPVPVTAEAVTGSFPVIPEHAPGHAPGPNHAPGHARGAVHDQFTEQR